MIQKLSSDSVRLCCNGQGCPVVKKINEDQYEVTDDFGNKILVRKAELALMTDAITAIDTKQQLICG